MTGARVAPTLGSMSAPTRSPERAVTHAVVTAQPIDVDALEALVGGPSHGAVVTFVGAVRDHDHGRRVQDLRYEGHPSAAGVLAQLVDAVVRRHPAVTMATAHRIGDLSVGDPAFVVVAGAAHRGEAFDACRDLVDTVKDGLPVWKLQRFTDGTQEWVNCA